MSSESLILSKPDLKTYATIRLTGSKSECNRALILNALSSGLVEVRNISSADDTQTLFNVLKSEAGGRKSGIGDERNNSPLTTHRSQPTTRSPQAATVNIGPAGTAMRFLTAFFAVTGTEVIITGTERMKQRPIGLLVNALRDLGAGIDYVENEGFPPLKFSRNFRQQKKHIVLKGDVSSQYITALLLVAPVLPMGLELEIEGELTSRPYVEMTLSMLRETGIDFEWNEQVISIPNQAFNPSTITVEPDWSAASYWYSIAALSGESEIYLPNLKKNSLQGDSKIASIMENFGVFTEYDPEGIKLVKKAIPLTRKEFDFKDCPDLAQTVVVCCAALNHNATFTGLETLKIKETDRVKALQNELAKIGVSFTEHNETYCLDCSGLSFPAKVSIETYEDHRMAMAFAPLALKIEQVEIEDPEVVGKSYPAFWSDLQSAGFEVKTKG